MENEIAVLGQLGMVEKIPVKVSKSDQIIERQISYTIQPQKKLPDMGELHNMGSIILVGLSLLIFILIFKTCEKSKQV